MREVTCLYFGFNLLQIFSLDFQILLTAIHWENVSDHAESINEIADLFKNRELYSTALKYYHMLEVNAGVHNVRRTAKKFSCS